LSVTALRAEAAGQLKKSSQERGKAKARLVPESDEGDFESAGRSLGLILAEISGTRTQIGKTRTLPPAEGLPESYRQSLLSGFDQKLAAEVVRVGSGLTALHQAMQLLQEEKVAMARTFEAADRGIVFRLDDLISEVSPYSTAAFQTTQSVHGAIVLLK